LAGFLEEVKTENLVTHDIFMIFTVYFRKPERVTKCLTVKIFLKRGLGDGKGQKLPSSSIK
jgi:hypothetical protein